MGLPRTTTACRTCGGQTNPFTQEPFQLNHPLLPVVGASGDLPVTGLRRAIRDRGYLEDLTRQQEARDLDNGHVGSVVADPRNVNLGDGRRQRGQVRGVDRQGHEICAVQAFSSQEVFDHSQDEVQLLGRVIWMNNLKILQVTDIRDNAGEMNRVTGAHDLIEAEALENLRGDEVIYLRGGSTNQDDVLSVSVVAIHPYERLRARQNLLWCSTFALGRGAHCLFPSPRWLRRGRPDATTHRDSLGVARAICCQIRSEL